MDAINSFKGYGKVDPREEQAFRRKTRKRLVILGISAVVLVLVIVGAVTGTVIHKRNNDKDDSTAAAALTSSQSIKAVCSRTQYPDSCYSSISQLVKSNTTTDPEELFKLSLQVVLNELDRIRSLPEKLIAGATNETTKNALKVCEILFDDAIDRLNDSISSMDVNPGEKLLSVAKINDLKTWLSTTVTDQETCLDALRDVNATLADQVTGLMRNSTEFASNSLAIVSKILSILGEFKFPMHRKLMGSADSGFPEWVSAGDRRLLQVVGRPTPNVTVAKDGSGNVTTLKEAVAMIPKKSLYRFVIYLKEGEYVENVDLDKSYWNVMIYGDGMTKSIISGSKNFIDGTPTFSTATFAIAGKGFIAMDIGFMNTAGAAKHQAVAFRSGSDFSVFYRCSFDAYQDTLYAHSNRQFYRECTITGTIDFIFGNAAVVFQNCQILPRQPMANQFVTITAQGKKDPNQNTGISIQKCTISALDSTLTAKTYLGRPWKDYSTTVIMQSSIGAFLDPAGWIEWVSGVNPPSTIFYGEYMNTGPGAVVTQRVKWAGYRPSLTADQASKYTVQTFLLGNDWLPQTNVQYQLSL